MTDTTTENHRELTYPWIRPPYRAKGYFLAVVAVATETGVVRAIWKSFSNPVCQLPEVVASLLPIVGQPGYGMTGEVSCEWTGATIHIPYYLKYAPPGGIYLFRRSLTPSGEWSFTFDRVGHRIADLPRGFVNDDRLVI